MTNRSIHLQMPRGQLHIQTVERAIMYSKGQGGNFIFQCQEGHYILKTLRASLYLQMPTGHYIFKSSSGPSCIQNLKRDIASSNSKRVITYSNRLKGHHVFKMPGGTLYFRSLHIREAHHTICKCQNGHFIFTCQEDHYIFK